MNTPFPPEQASTSSGDIIRDSSVETFAEDVLAASKTTPVIVDFWAPWCEPCKQLTPMLEKLVLEAGGAVRLVKVNVDENKMLASQMGIQSIPSVFAFVDGRPVDAFAGGVPESQVKEFIGKLTQATASEEDIALEKAEQALAAGEIDIAFEIFAALAKNDPQNIRVLTGLTKCHLAKSDLDQAKTIFGLIPPDAQNDPALMKLKAEIELAELSGDAGDVAELQAAVNADPSNLQALFDLADAFLAKNENEAAADALLKIIELDREWNDEGARKKLLTLFDVFGPMDPVTIKARRRLSSLLFS